MATTLTAQLNVQVVFNNFKDSVSPGSMTITLSGQGAVSGIQAIGTSSEDLDYGDLSAANIGWCFLQNLDATNFVTYGLNDSATIKEIGRLNATEWCFFRLKPSAQLMLKADTAACNVAFKVYRA